MLSPLIPDIRHPKWIIAQNVLECIDSKRAVKVASRLKIKDIDNFIIVMKILLISNLFERDVSNVVSEINAFDELKSFMKIKSEIKAQKIYRIQSNIDLKLIYDFLSRTMRPNRKSRNKKHQIVIIDTTSIVMDLNTWRKRYKIGKIDKKYKYSYCPSVGYYVGFKLILAIDQDYNLIGFKIHENGPNDAKILISFVEDLYRSKRIKSGDVIICDRGFTSKKNYKTLINRFLLIPAIYPRKNTNLRRIISSLTPPLNIFRDNYKLRKWFLIVENFKKIMNHWSHFKFIRYRIEIFFNIAKNSMNLKKNHQYTKATIEKKAARVMLLTEYLISMFNPIYTDLRRIPSW
jgi:hypothetical protein